MLKFDKERIQTIADWLDEVNYRMVCACILQHAQLPANSCFPDFNKANAIIRQENPMYGFIFSFFRLGHSATPVYLQKFIPEKIFKALVATGLVVRNKDNTDKMNHLALLPLNDIYLLSSLPVRYPTSDIEKTIFGHFSDEHYLFLNTMPGCFEGSNALELYGTHGVFGLQCAKNGLKTTVYPLDEGYQSILQFNIHLNRLENKIKLDHISNIKSQETKFDFICSRFPSFSDVLNENDPLYTDYNRIMKLYSDAFENLLPCLLSSTGLFLALLQSEGNQHSIAFNDNTLKPWGFKNNMNLLVNVLHKELLTFKLGSMIENTQRSWEREFGWITDNIKHKIEAFVQSDNFAKEEPVYIYTELIQGRRNHSGMSGFTLYPIYNPEKTDFLYLQSQMLNF
jgi:hypothetical protein